MQTQKSEPALPPAMAGLDRRLLEQRLFHRMPPGIDLRDEVQFEAVLATADELLDRVEDSRTLAEIEG